MGADWQWDRAERYEEMNDRLSDRIKRMHNAIKKLQKENGELKNKISEYEGENKRWHSFETVRAIVNERDALQVKVDILEAENEELRKHQIPQGWICHP